MRGTHEHRIDQVCMGGPDKPGHDGSMVKSLKSSARSHGFRHEFGVDFVQAFGEGVEEGVDLLVGNDQGRADGDHVADCAQDHAFEHAIVPDIDGVFRRARHLVARFDARRDDIVAVEAARARLGNAAKNTLIGAAAAEMARQCRADLRAKRLVGQRQPLPAGTLGLRGRDDAVVIAGEAMSDQVLTVPPTVVGLGHEQPVPIFQQLAGDHPPGRDDVRAIPASTTS